MCIGEVTRGKRGNEAQWELTFETPAYKERSRDRIEKREEGKVNRNERSGGKCGEERKRETLTGERQRP